MRLEKGKKKSDLAFAASRLLFVLFARPGMQTMMVFASLILHKNLGEIEQDARGFRVMSNLCAALNASSSKNGGQQKCARRDEEACQLRAVDQGACCTRLPCG
jgi:hypothetical protein